MRKSTCALLKQELQGNQEEYFLPQRQYYGEDMVNWHEVTSLLVDTVVARKWCVTMRNTSTEMGDAVEL
jgi:hypothetical protein